MSGPDLPYGVSIQQTILENQEAGVSFEIDRDGKRLTFGLSEADAIAVALAILGVSINIREGLRSSRWRPRLIEGGQTPRRS
jgi:hypothetical protein